MAVTKRTRFEVLRRDGFRCYYCGVRGNESTADGLTIDHVVPVALGGSDDPENLCAACPDCNAGKTSTPAGAELVAEIDRAVAAHKAARALALRALEADLDAESEYMDQVWNAWEAAIPQYARDNRDVESFAADWFRRGVPIQIVEKSLRIAWESNAARGQKVRYAGGVVNNLMRDAEDRARALAAGDNVVWAAGYDEGYDSGFQDGQTFERSRSDLVEAHIDGRHDTGLYAVMASDKHLPWRRNNNVA